MPEEPCYDKQFIRTAIQRFITHLMKIEANMTRQNRSEPSAALKKVRKTTELLRAVDDCIVSVEDFASPDMQEVLRTGKLYFHGVSHASDLGLYV